jgi:hypothetical protein
MRTIGVARIGNSLSRPTSPMYTFCSPCGREKRV